MSESGLCTNRLQTFETFVNKRLRKDLAAALSTREVVHAEIAEYSQLRTQIFALNPECTASLPTTAVSDTASPKDTNALEMTPTVSLVKAPQNVKAMVNIGGNMFMQARIHDGSRIFVRIGCNTHVELTAKEALAFVDRKVSLLEKRAENLTDTASQIRAKIKVVLEAMQELIEYEHSTAT